MDLQRNRARAPPLYDALRNFLLYKKALLLMTFFSHLETAPSIMHNGFQGCSLLRLRADMLTAGEALVLSALAALAVVEPLADAGEMQAAGCAMRLLSLRQHLAALVAQLYACALTVLAVALAVAAQVADPVRRAYPLLALQRIDARTMIASAARGVVSAQAVIAPEQAALLADCMQVGVDALIGLAAAALLRITVMLFIRLAQLVLRLGDAVAVGSGAVSAFTGIVALHAAYRDAMLADAAKVSLIAARRSLMLTAVRDAVPCLAAGCRGMLQAVAVVVPFLAADCGRVIQTVAHIMSFRSAGSAPVVHLVADIVAFNPADRRIMIQLILDAMAVYAAGRHGMGTRAGAVALHAADGRAVIPAVALIVAADAAVSTRMIHAVAVKVTPDPAGIRALVQEAVPQRMLGISALRQLLRRQRKRSHAQHDAQRQQQAKAFIPYLHRNSSSPQQHLPLFSGLCFVSSII